MTSVSWAPAVSAGSLASPDSSSSAEIVKRFATGGCDGHVRLWAWNDAQKAWAPDASQHQLEGHSDWVRDVAWAPSVGVGKGYLASAGQDKTVFLWTQDSPTAQWSRSALPAFGDVVWRVSWSVAGNVLAVSSGEWPFSRDGTVEIVKLTISTFCYLRRRQGDAVEGEPEWRV